MTVVAAANTGFYIGLGIGFVIVIVVVALVAPLLSIASRISQQAEAAAPPLEQVRKNTNILPQTAVTNDHAIAILAAAKAARGALTG